MKTNGRVYGLVNIVCAMNHDSSLRSMATRDFQKMIGEAGDTLFLPSTVIYPDKVIYSPLEVGKEEI